MAETLFWSSLFILLYTFLGYPIVLKCIASLNSNKHHLKKKYTPSVSIILSVYNEENVIKEKIDNFLSLDYPEELLEMVIVSDQCTDRTEKIIKSFNCKRIKLLIQERRSGKTMALNRGVLAAKGDVLIFTDANSMFDKDAVRKLVRHFTYPRIGLVSGKSVYLDSCYKHEEIGGTYRRYEEMIKEKESKAYSIVGADGAIYAMRKELYEPLKPEYINDFIHTIYVVLKGYRAISEPEAICREVIDETYKGELHRQIRIMAQSWLIYFSQIGKLIAKREWVFAWELTSHKFLRWLTIPFMITLFITTTFMFKEGKFYQMLFIYQSVFIFFVLFGRILRGRLMRAPYMFTLLHVASLLGFFKYLKGKIYVTWNPRND